MSAMPATWRCASGKAVSQPAPKPGVAFTETTNESVRLGGLEAFRLSESSNISFPCQMIGDRSFPRGLHEGPRKAESLDNGEAMQNSNREF
ncbi:hypothetical protein CC86DRAFT_101227 [Ophiobolus disseminans]|uniref:Uncharacterized protein n=1 Tax=Ophiobolus disseminans TaxID=1469910 RepID=A0A6A6ZLT4_9PLEO|nr:hypothetical protein CC86DRAFT_101227 [Ophiobolus disseminans]